MLYRNRSGIAGIESKGTICIHRKPHFSNTLIFLKAIERKAFFSLFFFFFFFFFFLKLKNDHSSHYNWWILSLIELDLYFMIIYLCIKVQTLVYKSSTCCKTVLLYILLILTVFCADGTMTFVFCHLISE